MATKGHIEQPNVGFDFSNFARNAHLGRQLGGLPKGELIIHLAEGPMELSGYMKD